MQALISGQAGLAVLIDGETVYSIEADAPGKTTSRVRADVLSLFHGANDVAQLDDITREEAESRLKQDRDRDIALRMSLILLDPNVTSDTRTLAAECVEERLDDGELTQWLLARLYQARMPESADLPGAIELTAREDLTQIHGKLKELRADQPQIQALVDSWWQIKLPASLQDADQAEIFDRLISAGACYEVARAATSGNAATAVFQLVDHPRLKPVSGIASVLSAWIAGLKKASVLAASEEPPSDRKSRKKKKEKKTKRSRSRAQESEDQTDHGAFERWQREFAGILKRIDAGDLENGCRFAHELVSRQIEEGHPELAAKSASNLSTEMKSRGHIAMRLEFAELAVEANPYDVQVFCHHAEALRENGQPDQALTVYRDSVQKFPNDVVALCGLATILMHDQQFDDVLNLLPSSSPRSERDLVRWHIRGMAQLRLNDLPSALKTFEIGLARSRREKNRSYYRNALAATYLQVDRPRDAITLLEEVSGELPDLFRTHAQGELDDRTLVRQALDRLRNSRSPQIQEAVREFEEVYLQNDPRKKRSTKQWRSRIFDMEIELVATISQAMYRVTL